MVENILCLCRYLFQHLWPFSFELEFGRGKKKAKIFISKEWHIKLIRNPPSTFRMASFFLIIKPYYLEVISDSTRNKKTGSLFSATQLLVPHKPLLFPERYLCRSGLSLCPWAQHAQATFILSTLRDGPISQILTDKMSLVGNGTLKRKTEDKRKGVRHLHFCLILSYLD